MSEFTLDFLTLFFSKIVELHTATIFPGTNWSIFSVVFLGSFGVVVVAVLRRFFGFASGGANLGAGGNNRNIKVSDERRGDTK